MDALEAVAHPRLSDLFQALSHGAIVTRIVLRKESFAALHSLAELEYLLESWLECRIELLILARKVIALSLETPGGTVHHTHQMPTTTHRMTKRV